MTRSTLVIPVDFPDPSLSTDMYVEGLSGFDVTLLGYWETPASTNLSAIHNVLIPLRDDRKRTKVVDFMGAFEPETTFVLELFHAAPEEDAVGEAERMLERVERTLLDRGFSESDLERTVEVSDDPGAAIVERARNHNLVVVGETAEPDAGHGFLGPVHRDIADRSETPIAVILE